MNWLEEYENMTEKDKELFLTCTNTLLGQTYLVAKRNKDVSLYRYCERRFELIRDYLHLSGWQLHHVKSHGFIYVKNQFDNSRHKFTLSETLFLFIVRLLYDEKERELNLTQQVMVNNRDILEKYNALNIKSRLPAREEYQRTLKLFQSYSLLELISGSWIDHDAVMVLYPSLVAAISSQSLDSIVGWIDNNDEGGETNEDIEQIADD